MEQYNQPTKQKDNRILIYSLLIGALLVSWGYFYFTNKKASEIESNLTSQNVAVGSELDNVKNLYDASLFRLDSLMVENEGLNESLSSTNTEISKMKMEIGKILSNKNATASDLSRARKMIGELNGKIAGLSQEVDRLKGENDNLVQTNTQILGEKQLVEENLIATNEEKENVKKELSNTKDIASTMRASNINIVALNLKNSGKVKETNKANRADKLRINFNIDDNRIAEPGPKDLFVVITNPAGKVVTYSNDDEFVKRDGNSQPFTSKVSVNFEGGKSMPVSFDWKNDKDFSEGNYKIEIYNNGFKIGESTRSLKKGGLF